MITAARLYGKANENDASTYTTSSISPTANALVLVAVGSTLQSSTTKPDNVPTVTGAGMTWVQVAEQLDGPTFRHVVVYRGLSSSPGSGALTVDFGGELQGRCEIIVDQFTGVDPSGTNGSGAIVQSAGNFIDSGSPNSGLSITLGTFHSTSNATYGAFRTNVNLTINAGSGFTALGSVSTVTFSTLMTEFRSDNSNTVDASWTSTDLSTEGIAIELNAAGISPSSSASPSASTSPSASASRSASPSSSSSASLSNSPSSSTSPSSSASRSASPSLSPSSSASPSASVSASPSPAFAPPTTDLSIRQVSADSISVIQQSSDVVVIE